MAKQTVKTLKEIADGWWSIIVRQRAGYVCEWCGEKNSPRFDAHHVIPKKYTATRYNLDNGVCLCMGCHPNRVHDEDPAGFSKWFMEYRPGLYEELRALAIAGAKYDHVKTMEGLKNEGIRFGTNVPTVNPANYVGAKRKRKSRHDQQF